MQKAAGAGALCVLGHVADANTSRSLACEVQCEGHSKTHSHKGLPSQFAHDHDRGSSAHLLFAVPKKGRMYETVSKLLAGSGIEYKRKDRLDIAHCTNLPLSIVFLPAADIATYVGEGEVDIGITGEDVVAESEVDVITLMELGFGACNLSVQAPKAADISDVGMLAGKRIVTSFPNLTRKFFSGLEQPGGAATQIKCISGSVEASCGLGLADGIVDLVETGSTMRAAGLEEIALVMKSQAVLIKNPESKHPELIELVRRRVQGYLTAQRWVMVTYNVARVNLVHVEKITPGKRSPSIQPLEDEAWVAVNALVPKGDAATIMDDLEAAGARDILLSGLLSTRLGD